MKYEGWNYAAAVKRATCAFKSPRVLVTIRKRMEAEGYDEEEIRRELEKIKLIPTVEVDL